jgi:hypothetical protein
MMTIAEKETQFIEELKLVQAVVTRMAQNSFFIKGWAITLIGVMLALNKDALLGNAQNWFLCLLISIVIYCFWYLDAYFLRLERIFRKHYDWLLLNKEEPTRQKYELTVMSYYIEKINPKKPVVKRYGNEPVESEFQIMLSDSLKLFYLVPFLASIGIMLFQIMYK